jgi:hypothetical protein
MCVDACTWMGEHARMSWYVHPCTCMSEHARRRSQLISQRRRAAAAAYGRSRVVRARAGAYGCLGDVRVEAERQRQPMVALACSARVGLREGRAYLSRPGPGRASWRRFGAARRTSDTSRFPPTRLTVRRWRSRYTSAAGVPPRPPSAPFSPPHPLPPFLFLPLPPSLSFSLFISLQTRACARLHSANLWPTRMRSPLTRHMEAERARSSDSE